MLGKEERGTNVKSVMMINRVLFQLSFKFGGVNLTDRFIWTSGTIKLADRSFKAGFHFNRTVTKRSVFHCVLIICSAGLFTKQ